MAALLAADVPAGPVNTIPEALRAMGEGWTQTIEGIELAPSPIHVGGAATGVRLPPPKLGEHTAAVLAELESGP